ncbi:MAG: hypothetical protein C4527_07605 [Candidatus Omnitrophota bacterium]|jgi:hypothetical protein|nr:MAG: hypothetical protein C4527_07605 [Candidatus Omnitrophota bacterium]
MNGLFYAALDLQHFCAERDWAFCFIGGLAVLRWGEHRITRDVDLSLLVGYGNERNYVETLLNNYKTRISDAYNFAMQNRVVLIVTENGVPADITLSAIPYEEALIHRASLFAYAPDCALTTCSAEDLIILKTFAGREKDWMDVVGIVARQGARLDRTLIFETLPPLLRAKDAMANLDRLRSIMNTP